MLLEHLHVNPRVRPQNSADGYGHDVQQLLLLHRSIVGYVHQPRNTPLGVTHRSLCSFTPYITRRIPAVYHPGRKPSITRLPFMRAQERNRLAPWSGPTRPTPPGPRPTTPCPTGASAGRQVRCCNVSMGASVSPCWTKLLTEVRRLAPKYVPVAQLADKRNPFAPPRSTSRPCRSERSWTRPIESRASRQSRQRSRSAWPSLELS